MLGFRGLVLKNPISGKLEVDFPEAMRTPRRQLSLLFSCTIGLLLLATMTSIFFYKALLTEEADEKDDDDDGGSSSGDGGNAGKQDLALLLPALLNAVQIVVFGVLYKSVAQRLTEYENYKTMADHNVSRKGPNRKGDTEKKVGEECQNQPRQWPNGVEAGRGTGGGCERP